jgi:hypothetical protein
LKVSDFTDTTVDAFGSAKAFATNLVQPTIRLGVTGLARSGKTVFITSLIHNLLTSGRLPFFDAAAEARIRRVYLEPQPDDAVPRFDYEQHIADLTADEPRWPQSTRRLSQVRITIDYQPQSFWKRQFGHDRLHVDIVDYPGEWLLDLPLLEQSFSDWSQAAIARARAPKRKGHAKAFLDLLNKFDPASPQSETAAQELAQAYTSYLARCRDEGDILIAGPPGRFLMPGDMEGSPALTFSPLNPSESADEASLWSMMARRYEAYKTHVIKPFFRDHFSRLDRQIVLVDALGALNTGKEALGELEATLAEILQRFRPGANSWLSSVLRRRIDRIAFAATKADHLHHTSHDRLEAILSRLVGRAISRAEFAGADVKVLALAAIRTTREGEVSQRGEKLPCILGYPMRGETIGGKTFDGKEEYAVFPGDLPDDPEKAFTRGKNSEAASIHFVRFRPPRLEKTPLGSATALPHIRLDRAINFLVGDRLS